MSKMVNNNNGQTNFAFAVLSVMHFQYFISSQSNFNKYTKGGTKTTGSLATVAQKGANYL